MSRTSASARVGDLGITKALMLNGAASQYINFGAQTFLDGTPFTMCARIWPTRPDMADDGVLWAYGWANNGNPNSGYMLRTDAAAKKVYFWWGSSNITASNTFMIGKKYLFAEFNGATSLKLYVDTTLKDTLTIAARTSSGSDTRIGSRSDSARYFSGVVGDAAIYNRVLTAAEKSAIVSTASYPLSGAQLIIKTNENTGTTITDYSGNARNGTLQVGTGSATWRNSPFNA